MKLIKNTFLLTFIILLTFSCDKLPANGDLDGMWQVMTIKHDGVTTDVKQEQSYLSIQLKLVMLGYLEDSRRFYGYFDHKGDSLIFRQISHPSKNETSTDDNVPLTEDELYRLHRWGIYRLTDRFKILSLSNETMVLQSDSATVSFRKF